MGAEIVELRLTGIPINACEWQRDLRITHVERVEEWLMMDVRGVINIEGDFADQSEGILTVLVIEDAHILRDQTAEWIER